MEDSKYFSKDISHVTVNNPDPLLKVKLAFFYIWSVENIRII